MHGTEAEPVAGAQRSLPLNRLAIDPRGEAFLFGDRPHNKEAAVVALEPAVGATDTAAISHRQDELIFPSRSVGLGVKPAQMQLRPMDEGHFKAAQLSVGSPVPTHRHARKDGSRLAAHVVREALIQRRE